LVVQRFDDIRRTLVDQASNQRRCIRLRGPERYFGLDFAHEAPHLSAQGRRIKTRIPRGHGPKKQIPARPR
jgi:hypothetical protein